MKLLIELVKKSESYDVKTNSNINLKIKLIYQIEKRMLILKYQMKN